MHRPSIPARFLALSALFAVIVAWPAVAGARTHAAGMAERPSAYVQGCNYTGPILHSQSFICIGVFTGAKNSSNHTQWIDSIDLMPAGPTGLTEAWADGYYRASYTTGTVTWQIDRWVHSGTNVCGAYTYPGGQRGIACIAIRV